VNNGNSYFTNQDAPQDGFTLAFYLNNINGSLISFGGATPSIKFFSKKKTGILSVISAAALNCQQVLA